MSTETSRPPLAERALSERVRSVPPSGIRRFFDILATMDDVISLGVGEPDFDTPRAIVEAGVESLREGRTHYTSNFGTFELRKALSAPPRAPVRRRLRPGDRAADHGRRLGGGRPRVARHLRPGRRGHPPRAVVRRLRAGRRVRGRRRAPRRDPLRGRLRARSGRRRGGDHAAHEGAVPRLPVQSHGRGPAGGGAGRAGRDRGSPRPPRVRRRDLRPARLRHVPPPGDERAARHARADDPDGRLLEGLRDDRLARRLGGRAGGHPRGHREGAPVRDHVGPHDRPGRGAHGASSKASPRSSGCAPSTTGDGA